MRRSQSGSALSQAAVLLALSVVAGTASHFWHPMAPAWYLVEAPLLEDEVTLADLGGGKEVLWLDARPREQFEAGRIPGAYPLSEQEFDQQLFELLEVLQTNTLPVIIYCGGERCEASRKIKERLLETMPLENVRILRGGWKSWTEAGGAVEKGG